MTTKQKMKDIDEVIQKEFDAFYQGKPDLNLKFNLRDIFEKSVMVLPLTTHKMHVNKIKELHQKDVKDFTRLELGLVFNIIASVPLKDIGKDFNEAIWVASELDRVRVEFNSEANVLEEKMAKKRKSLMEIHGIGNTGMSVIKP